VLALQCTALHAMSKIVIPLKQQQRPASFPPDFQKQVELEYACKYLETLGVTPSTANCRLLLKRMPLQTCNLIAAWRSRGCLTDALIIEPRCGKKHRSSEINVAGDENSGTPNNTAATTAATQVVPSAATEQLAAVLPATAQHHAQQQQLHQQQQHQQQHDDVIDCKVMAELRRALQRPPAVTPESVQSVQASFIRTFPFAQYDARLTAKAPLAALKELLRGDLLVRFVGLTAHYLFWNLILPSSQALAEALQVQSVAEASSVSSSSSRHRGLLVSGDDSCDGSRSSRSTGGSTVVSVRRYAVRGHPGSSGKHNHKLCVRHTTYSSKHDRGTCYLVALSLE
jgi:outer membrane protein OmpA-like peptidoglycan-associated protein